MELDRFQILKSYAVSIRSLAQADESLAEKLSFYIIQYGIFGEEPPKKSNPILLALFNQIKIPIDKCRNKSQNAVKNWEKIGNQIEIKGESNGNQIKSNGNQTEIKSKENIKYKNIKNKNNNNDINIISETEKNNQPVLLNENILLEEKEKVAEKEKEFGNGEVNLCMNLIKQYNGGITNGSDTLQRRYAWNLIRKLKKIETVEKGEYERNNVLEIILKIISEDEYYSSKISSPQLIYNNLATLMQRCKNGIKKVATENQTPLEKI